MEARTRGARMTPICQATDNKMTATISSSKVGLIVFSPSHIAPAVQCQGRSRELRGEGKTRISHQCRHWRRDKRSVYQ